MAVLFVALISPLDALGETLLSAHMAQHGFLALASRGGRCRMEYRAPGQYLLLDA